MGEFGLGVQAIAHGPVFIDLTSDEGDPNNEVVDVSVPPPFPFVFLVYPPEFLLFVNPLILPNLRPSYYCPFFYINYPTSTTIFLTYELCSLISSLNPRNVDIFGSPDLCP